jgi:hypothetical protein
LPGAARPGSHLMLQHVAVVYIAAGQCVEAHNDGRRLHTRRRSPVKARRARRARTELAVAVTVSFQPTSDGSTVRLAPSATWPPLPMV